MTNQTPPSQQSQGLVVNSKVISTMVGVITILSTFFYVIDKINNYEYRIEKIEYSDSLRNSELKTLTSELKTLNSELTGLTIELREMRAENKAIQQLYKNNK